MVGDAGVILLHCGVFGVPGTFGRDLLLCIARRGKFQPVSANDAPHMCGGGVKIRL